MFTSPLLTAGSCSPPAPGDLRARARSAGRLGPRLGRDRLVRHGIGLLQVLGQARVAVHAERLPDPPDRRRGAADADPATGVSVDDSFHFHGWHVFGGTSVSAPIIAAVYARAGVPKAGDPGPRWRRQPPGRGQARDGAVAAGHGVLMQVLTDRVCWARLPYRRHLPVPGGLA